MPYTDKAIMMLVAAAVDLAESRREDQTTSEEWDALERALLAADEAGEVSLAFEGGQFVRRSTFLDGGERIESIGIEDIEAVAQSIEEDVDPGMVGWFVVDELVSPTGRTWIECLIAVEWMKRAGLLRERDLDNRLYRADGFSADKAIDAFRIDAGLT